MALQLAVRLVGHWAESWAGRLVEKTAWTSGPHWAACSADVLAVHSALCSAECLEYLWVALRGTRWAVSTEQNWAERSAATKAVPTETESAAHWAGRRADWTAVRWGDQTAASKAATWDSWTVGRSAERWVCCLVAC